MNVANPYAAPALADEQQPDGRLERATSLALTLIGFTLSTVASIGALLKLSFAVRPVEWWEPQFIQGVTSSNLGIGAFAVASWLLLALMSNVDAFTDRSRVVFSKALILIAIVAMLARLVSEPADLWTPSLPSYLLTFAAAVAMTMVLYRIQPSCS